MTRGHISYRCGTSQNRVALGRCCKRGAPGQLSVTGARVRLLLGSTQNRSSARQLLPPDHQALSQDPQEPLTLRESPF